MKAERLILIGAGAIGLSAILTAGDWPQWRGPQRNAVSSEAGLLKEWPKEGPKLLWQNKDIGDGYSTPSVAGNRIYVMSNRGLDNEFAQALSVQDGKVLWATVLGKVGNPDQRPNFPCARSTPTVDGDALIVTPGGAVATLVALNKKTGETIWKSAVPGGDMAGYASAIVVEAAGRKHYVQFLMKGLVGVDAKTGQFLWRYEGALKGQYQTSTPIALKEQVYIAAGGNAGGGLVRLTSASGGVAAEQVYFTPGLPNGEGGAVLVDGIVYGGTNRGLAAADFMTGKPLWQAAQGEGVGPGSIVYADGRLYFHGFNNNVALVEATPEGYRERGRFTPLEPPKHVRGQMERSWPHPVVANGRLYIRDLESLWCYDIGGR